MISATVEPPWLDSQAGEDVGEDVLGRAGRDAREVVEQRLRRRRADHAEDRDQRQQHREQREHAEVGQRGGPGRELVLSELLEGPLQDRREGLLGQVGRLVGDVACRCRSSARWADAAWAMPQATQIGMRTPFTGRQFPDRAALWTPCTAPCRLVLGTFMLARARPAPGECRLFPVRRQRSAPDRRHRPAAGADHRQPRRRAPAPRPEAGGALPATPLPVTGGALFARTTLDRRRAAVAGRRPPPPASASCNRRCRCPAARARSVRRCPAAACSPSRASGPSTSGPALAALSRPPGRCSRVKGLTADASASCRAGTPGPDRQPRASARSPCSAPSSSHDRAVDRNLDARLADRSTRRRSTSRRCSRPPASTSRTLQATLQPILDTLPERSRSRRSRCASRPTPGAQTRHRRPAHPPRAADRDRRARRHAAARRRRRRGDRRRHRRQLRLDRRRRARARRQGRLHDAPADADRRRAAGATASCCRAPPTRAASPARTVRIRSLLEQAHRRAPQGAPKSGLFTTYVKLPPALAAPHQRAPATARHRQREVARAQARPADDRHRRCARPATRKVTLSGRDLAPARRRRSRQITVTRRISCGAGARRRALQAGLDGRFKVTLNAPRTDRVYTFRFRSRVRYSTAYPTAVPDVHASAIRGRELAIYNVRR